MGRIAEWIGKTNDRKLIAIAIVIGIIVFVGMIATKPPPYVCPRSHDGYPLISFEVTESGSEWRCRYGTGEVAR
jgi:hypothetical protein